MISGAARLILRDMAVDQPRLSGSNLGVGFAQRSLAFPERLDLSPYENEARLECVEQVVIVRGGAILRDNFHALAIGFFRPCFRHALS